MQIKNFTTAKPIMEITVIDPDSLLPVEVTLYKHNESGSIFGIDNSYIEQMFEDNEPAIIPDPFNEEYNVKLLE